MHKMVNCVINSLLNKPLKECGEAELRLVEIIRNYPEEQAILITKGWVEATRFIAQQMKEKNIAIVQIDSHVFDKEKNK